MSDGFAHADEASRIVDTSYRYDDYYHDAREKGGEEHELHQKSREEAREKSEAYLQEHYPAYELDELSNRNAVVAVNDKDKLIVLGFRGTKFDNLADITADLEIATGRHLEDPDLKKFIKDNILPIGAMGVAGVVGKKIYKDYAVPKSRQVAGLTGTLEKVGDSIQTLADSRRSEERLMRGLSGGMFERQAGRPFFEEETRIDIGEAKSVIERRARQLDWALRNHGYEGIDISKFVNHALRTRRGEQEVEAILRPRIRDIEEIVARESTKESAYNEIVGSLKLAGTLGAIAYESMYLRHAVNYVKNLFGDYYGGVLSREGEYKSMREWEGLGGQMLKWTGIISSDKREGELHQRFKDNQNLFDLVREKYPNYKIVPAGHSLGAIASMKLATDNSIEGIHINAGAFTQDWTHVKTGNALQTHLQTIHSKTGTPDPIGAVYGSHAGTIYRTKSKESAVTKLPEYLNTLNMAMGVNALIPAVGALRYGGIAPFASYILGVASAHVPSKIFGMTLETMETHGLHNFFDDGMSKKKESKLVDYYDTEHLVAVHEEDRTKEERVLHRERNVTQLHSIKNPRIEHHYPVKSKKYELDIPNNSILRKTGLNNIYSYYIDRYGNEQEIKRRGRRVKKTHKKRRRGRPTKKV